MSEVQTRLTPGKYRLLGDLAPLRKDKRRTSDWRYNPIETGTLFYVTVRNWRNGTTEYRIYPTSERHGDLYSVAPNESYETRFLEEALVRVDETVSDWLRREHAGINITFGVLDELERAGKITLADVQGATDRYLASLEDT